MPDENHDQLATLAPGAGQGVVREVFKRLLDDPQTIDEMVQAAHDGLKAMAPRRWDKDSQTWIQDPDYRVRVQTLFGLFAQAEGEPIKRIIHEVRKGVGGAPDEMLAESPAAIEAAKRMIAGAEARRRKADLKKAEVVDVDV